MRDRENQSVFANPEIARAIHQIVVRNEQMVDEKSVLSSFYDDNMLERLDNVNNQIIQGRRGTGKTHLLRVLACTLCRSMEYAIYIDCKKFGDTGILDVKEENIKQKSTDLFRHFIKCFLDNVTEYYDTRNFEFTSEQVQKEVSAGLKNIAKACEDQKQITKEVVQESEDSQKDSRDIEGSIKIEKLIGLFSSCKNSFEKGKKVKKSMTYQEQDVITFPSISKNIDNITKVTQTRIYLLIDEWSSIPILLQPIFAEFLKRCFMCCQYITVKIAVTYQTRLSYKFEDNSYIGLERSTEISGAIDLDQQLMFDKKPKRVIRFMTELLIRHVNVMAGKQVLSTENLYEGFEEDRGFIVLVRASEGNARDFINILGKCLANMSFSDEERKERIKIDDIIEAAHTWFHEDKCCGISELQLKQFNELYRYIVLQKRTRGAFIYENQLLNHDIIKLLDARFIHLVSRGHTIRYMPKENLALIILDYGSYCNELRLGMCLDLFNDDSWEKLCRYPKGIKAEQNYWPYDRDRSVVSCFIDVEDNRIFSQDF